MIWQVIIKCSKVIYTVKFQYETSGHFAKVAVGTGFSDVFLSQKKSYPVFAKLVQYVMIALERATSDLVN